MTISLELVKGRSIDFVFDSSIGFAETADRIGLLPTGPNPRWRPAAILKISNNDISETGHPINFLFDPRCLLLAASKPQQLVTFPLNV